MELPIQVRIEGRRGSGASRSLAGRALGGVQGALILALVAALPACDSSYACGKQSVRGETVEGCTDPLDCDYETCEVSFTDCGGDAPKVVCAGSSCTCFDGDQEVAACGYNPGQCPMDLDVQVVGDATGAMRFFERCCHIGMSID